MVVSRFKTIWAGRDHKAGKGLAKSLPQEVPLLSYGFRSVRQSRCNVKEPDMLDVDKQKGAERIFQPLDILMVRPAGFEPAAFSSGG